MSALVVETLKKFGAQQATKDEVMRALCEHTGWCAPAGYALAAMNTNTFDHLSVWGTQSRVAPGKLYLFTERTFGERAVTKVELGPYASPLPGAKLFNFMPAGFTELHVNPGSDPSEGWFMGGEALLFAKLWGQAIFIEQIMSGKLEGNLVDAMLAFEGFTAFTTPPSGAIATAVGAAGLKNPAMIFTAPDCAEKAIAKFGAQAANLKRVTFSGERLFTSFSGLGVDGLLFNPFGPGPVKVFTTEIVNGFIESIALRKKADALEAEAKKLEGA